MLRIKSITVPRRAMKFLSNPNNYEQLRAIGILLETGCEFDHEVGEKYYYARANLNFNFNFNFRPKYNPIIVLSCGDPQGTTTFRFIGEQDYLEQVTEIIGEFNYLYAKYLNLRTHKNVTEIYTGKLTKENHLIKSHQLIELKLVRLAV